MRGGSGPGEGPAQGLAESRSEATESDGIKGAVKEGHVGVKLEHQRLAQFDVEHGALERKKGGG